MVQVLARLGLVQLNLCFPFKPVQAGPAHQATILKHALK
jgi:hypothetical protein